MNRCYFDGKPCSCSAMDVIGECPRDTFQHEDDERLNEEDIDDMYYALQHNCTQDDYTERM